MKKILFSSVCALALCGTSVFAVEGIASSSSSSTASVTEVAPTPNEPTNWEKLSSKADSDKTTAESAFKALGNNAVGTKYTAYTTAVDNLKKAKAVNEVLTYFKSLSADKGLITGKDDAAELLKDSEWDTKVTGDIATKVKDIEDKYGLTAGTIKSELAAATAKKVSEVETAHKVSEKQKGVADAEITLKQEVKKVDNGMKVALEFKKAYEDAIVLAAAKDAAAAVDTASQDIEKHKTTIRDKQGALGNKDDQADASGKLYAVMKDKANTLIGDYKKATTPEDLSAVKSLNEVVKYYEDEKKGNDAEKVKAVKAIIAKVEKGEEVDFGTELKDVTFSGTVATDYTSAQGDVKTTENELATAEENLAKARKTLTAAEAKLKQAVLATPVAKEKAEKVKKSLGELYAVSGKAGEKFITLLAMENVDDVTKLDSTADKELIEQIKAVANEVAQEVVNNKKEEISSNALTSLAIQLNNMNKRLGEVRGMGGDTGVWTRVYGGKYSTDYDKFNYYSAQIGADKKSALKDGDLILGILAGYDKVNADIKTDAYSFGIYGSYIHNSGFFADSVMKFVSTSHDKSGWDIANQKSFLASLEGGYRFDASESFYVEPSLEFITGHVSEYSAKQAKTTTTVESFSPVIFKPQTFIGVNLDDLAFRFGGGYVLNAKKQEANIMIEDIVAGVNASASTKLEKNNHGFVSLGTSYKIGDNLRLNLSAERTFGGELQKDYEINTTIRYSF